MNLQDEMITDDDKQAAQAMTAMMKIVVGTSEKMSAAKFGPMGLAAMVKAAESYPDKVNMFELLVAVNVCCETQIKALAGKWLEEKKVNSDTELNDALFNELRELCGGNASVVKIVAEICMKDE